MAAEDELVLGDDALSLERQVCFAVAVANRAILSVYRPLLEPLQLTHPQYLVMLTLWESEPRTVKGIGELLQLDSATLSPLLKRLEAVGYVTRTRSVADERSLTVALTEEGRALREQAMAIPGAVVEALGVSLPELEALHEVLSRFNSAALDARVA